MTKNESTNHRKEPRTPLRHRLSITLDRHFGRGEIHDWSLHGIKISSSIALQGHRTCRVRFHVEKETNLTENNRYWYREGDLRWTEKLNGHWVAGIQLDETLEDLGDHLGEGDSCYLYIENSPKTDEPSS